MNWYAGHSNFILGKIMAQIELFGFKKKKKKQFWDTPCCTVWVCSLRLGFGFCHTPWPTISLKDWLYVYLWSPPRPQPPHTALLLSSSPPHFSHSWIIFRRVNLSIVVRWLPPMILAALTALEHMHKGLGANSGANSWACFLKLGTKNTL